MVAYATYDASGPDPFTTPIALTGHITHGLLPENANPLGGIPEPNLPNPMAELGTVAQNDTVDIKDFTYTPGDINENLGDLSEPPVIHEGQSLTFVNEDNSLSIYHTVTSCQLPCTASTGVGYPTNNTPAATSFDSGELGTGPQGFTAASGTVVWKTPPNLPPGTYAYYCRIHPWMRGTFRVIP